MCNICVQLEKVGFIGITREIVCNVLVQYGYNYEGIISGRLGTIRKGWPEIEKSENYIKSAYIIRISINDIAFHLHILRFEFDCYNYIFNTLVGHGLLLTDDSTITSSTGAITPNNLDKPEDNIHTLDDLEDLKGYGDDMISNFWNMDFFLFFFSNTSLLININIYIFSFYTFIFIEVNFFHFLF